MIAQISLLQARFEFSTTALVCLTVLVALWAMIQPATVRDAEKRKLPANVTARILFVFIYVLLYIALVAAVAVSGNAAANLGVPDELQKLLDAFKGQAPLIAITLLAALHSLSYFRDLENGLVIWLHSARHLGSDVRTLSTHLQTCSYRPSEAEKEKNVNYLRDFDVYLTDTNANVLRLEAVNAWGKTSTLLRFVRTWNTEKERVLDAAEMALLEELEKAHGRKTRLAMDIIRMLDSLDRGGLPDAAIKDLAAMLAGTSHRDEKAVSEIETRVRGVVAERQDTSRPPVRLTSGQFQQYLAQIESYFRVEYTLLLERIARLTAKSVVLSGDEAPQRLEKMKAVGFGQLGKIAPVNFDRVLWMFFAVTLGSFLVFFFNQAPRTSGTTIGPNVIFQIAIVMAMAALTGAIFGSSRRLAQRPSTPWAAYLSAGLIAAGLFVLVHGAGDMLRQISKQADQPAATSIASKQRDDARPRPGSPQDRTKAEPGASAASRPAQGATVRREPGFLDRLPWAASPFFIAVAICLLARLRRWPRPDWAPEGVWERIMDGLVLAAVGVLAQTTANSLHIAFDTSRAEDLRMWLEGTPMKFFVRPPSVIIGFFVGALVVRDVRVAAHGQLTDPSMPTGAAEPPTEQVFGERALAGETLAVPARAS